ARSAARQRELGLRTALGAKRWRLVRQMLTESLALAAAGGLAGLVVAAWCHRALLALVGDRIAVPRLDQMTLDFPVVAFTMAVAACLPVPFACIGTSFWRADRPKPADGQLSSGQVRPVTPRFFTTLGIPHVIGRDFSDSDTVDSMPVAIVSEELVKQQFGDGS